MGTASAGGAAAPNGPRRPRFLEQRYLAAGSAALVAIVLLATALHYRGGSQRRQYEKLLKDSLDRLVTAQEGFYYDSTKYTASLAALPGVRLPTGVHVRMFNDPSRRSWWGVATHDRLRGRHCVVWVGTAPLSLPRDARAPEDETKVLCFDDARSGS
ncbi:MAG TPA: hypothetical protein VGJ18_27850 [Gemmatimonadaceae bacterium]|jgi:hypothetical protein